MWKGMLKEATDAGIYKTACVFIADNKKISEPLKSKNRSIESILVTYISTL